MHRVRSALPQYRGAIFLILYGVFNSTFCQRNGRGTARPKEPIGADDGSKDAATVAASFELSSTPIGYLVRAVLQEKLQQNSGTEGAPWGDGPSLEAPVLSFRVS